MKTFVTGGAGFLGSHLTERLVRAGHEVTCLVRRTTDRSFLSGVEVRYVFGDIAEGTEGLEDGLRGAEIVYHVAGAIRAKDAAGFRRVNVAGTERLLEACARFAPGLRRFVLVSSIAAVGPPVGDEPLREDIEPHPVTEYGRSKLAGERSALRFRDSMSIAILRPPPIYGPRDREMLDLFKTVARGLRPVVGLRPKRANFAYVLDVVEGCVLAGEAPAGAFSSGEIFHVGSENLSLEEVCRTIAAILGRRTVPVFVPHAALYAAAAVIHGISRLRGRPSLLSFDKVRELVLPNWTVDISKIRRVLGFEPRWPFCKGAEATIAWAREAGWL